MAKLFYLLFNLTFIFVSLHCAGDDSREYLFDKVRKNFKELDYKAAIENLNTIISSKPKDNNAFLLRGIAKEQIKDFTGAVNDFNTSIELDNKFAEAYYWRAGAKAELGEYNEAIKDIGIAIELNPEFARAYYWRGYTKAGIKDYKGAMQDLNRAIEIDPKLSRTYYWRSNQVNHGKINSELTLSSPGMWMPNPALADIHFWNGSSKAEFK